MSVAYKFKSLIPSIFPKTSTELTPSPYRPRVSEAPDAGYSRSQEAPDAGYGRTSSMEHEFTHGRSQS